MMNITPLLSNAIAGSAPESAQSAPVSSNKFLDMVNDALTNVSSLQAQASTAEQSFAAGDPGATLGKALVGSDRAEVAWNATVAVRDEVVSAYQSIMNMQF